MSLSVHIRKQVGSFALNVHFDTEDAVTGLLGASGCGKSMTLQCIAGVLRPDAGRIILDGQPLFDSARGIDLPPQQRGVGLLFQQYALFPHMTVRQNILCGLRRFRDKAERERRLYALCQTLALSGLEDHRPAQLSGGQAQRAALARMLAAEPRLLLLDEPFSALDSHLRDRLQPQLLSLLRSYGRQALLVTHSRDEAYRLCSRLCVMEHGCITRCGDTHAVFSDPRTESAARLTGCKNIFCAVKAAPHTVRLPSLGLCLTTSRPVPDTLYAVGLHAHAFDPSQPHNRFPVHWVERVEEPFETILLFRSAGQDPHAPPLWWRVPRDRLPHPLPEALGIDPQDILLLTNDPKEASL